jgi:hypothetical protein
MKRGLLVFWFSLVGASLALLVVWHFFLDADYFQFFNR